MSAQDRRSYTRYQVDWRVRIGTSRKTVGVGRIRDVSLGGALLESSLFFKDGERLQLEIFPLYRGKQRHMDATVIIKHHRQLKNTGYVFGVEFLFMPDHHRKLLLNVISVQSGCQPIFDDSELNLED